MEEDGAPDTPSALEIKPASDALRPVKSSYSPISPFCSRISKFVASSCFNGHLQLPGEENAGSESEMGILKRLPHIQRCKLEILSKGPEAGCRYMADRTEDKWYALDRRILNFGRILAEKRNVRVWNHVALASQEPIFAVGRVCCDGEGSLNESSVLLEGSVEHSGGQRVRLDLRDIPEFSLFPGQVIGVEGKNPSGHCLVASRIFSSLPLPSEASVDEDSPSAKRQSINGTGKQPAGCESLAALCIVAAAGPFTTADNLAFEPLEELLNYARKKRPNLLLLMGPFVDSEHPKIKSGQVDKLFREIFQEEVRARIETYCEDMGAGARVALVPSTRDSHHCSLFPQPAFDSSDFEDPDKQISLPANPVVFWCNEVKIGCCTVDVLRHLSSEEISRVSAGSTSDRMTRLASHIISQRRFYPLFPPPSGAVVDLSVAPGSLDLPCNPDMMFFPSDLNPFVKASSFSLDDDVTGGPTCLCINPGRLAKGINGGTFAEVLVVPVANEDQSGLTERTKVTIVKI